MSKRFQIVEELWVESSDAYEQLDKCEISEEEAVKRCLKACLDFISDEARHAAKNGSFITTD